MSRIFLVLVLMLSFGCSDKREASKSNFKDTINDYFAKNCILIDINLPYTFKKYQDKKSKNFKLQSFDTNSYKQYEFFHELGFLEQKEKMTKEKSWDDNHRDILLLTYELSKKGQEKYQSSKKSFFGSQNGFCAGNYKVKEILNFTEPSQMFGYTISEVQMSLEVDTVPNFAKTEKFSKVFKNFRAYENRPKSIILVLTDNGWVSEKEIR